MSNYTKLFASIVRSSIWDEPYETKIVWITMLAISDKDGFVESSIPGLAHMSRVPLDDTIAALKVLSSPDEYSQSKGDDGRRIEAVDNGWFIINRAKYRDKSGTDDRRIYLEKKQQEARDFKLTTGSQVVATSKKVVAGYVYYLAKDNKIKIALSKNPWARLSAALETTSEAFLMGYEIGDSITERGRLAQFKHLVIKDNIFRNDPELLQFIANLPQVKSNAERSTTTASTTMSQEEKEKEIQKDILLRNISAQPEGMSDVDEESSIPPEAYAEYNRAEDQTPRPSKVNNEPAQVDFAMDAEDKNDGKQIPFGQIMSIFKRICPELKLQAKGNERDRHMKKFWRDHGKTASCFELLAQKVHASDYIMARNGHTGKEGKPYPWSWIFCPKDTNQPLRATLIMRGEYSTEAMAFILAKKNEPLKPNKKEVTIVGQKNGQWLDMNELWDGKPRWVLTGEDNMYSGLPEVRDMKQEAQYA